ncbi:TPA: hypothetical protein I4D55_001234 [Enterobacter hormaechei]|nr:hypothetical protein [Enterobacter hormaechei]
MSTRYCVYSLFVPKDTLINYLDSKSHKVPSFSLKLTVEIFFIFDLDRQLTLPNYFVDNELALIRCNEENISHGRNTFNFVNYIASEDLMVKINGKNYKIKCNKNQEKLNNEKLNTKDNIGIMIDGFKKIAYNQYVSITMNTPKNSI